MTPRPTALAVNVDAIPAVLKAEPRWVMWRYVWKAKENASGRWSKIVCLPDGTYAKSNDPATWTNFDTVIAAYRRGGFDGIGFCLGDGWCGIDLDRCRAMAFPLHNRLPDCYLEVSPSGNGFKAIGRAARTGGEINYGVNPPAHTPWHGARFFAITGHDAKGDPTIDLTALLDNLFPMQRQSIAPPAVPDYITVGDTRGTENIQVRTDDDVLIAAATAKFRPEVIEAVIGRTLAELNADQTGSQIESIEQELREIKTALSNMIQLAAAGGGNLATLASAMGEHESRQRQLDAELAGLKAQQCTFDPLKARTWIEERLTNWKRLLRNNREQGRQVLQNVLTERLESDGLTFRGTAVLGRILRGDLSRELLASPTGGIPEWTRETTGEVPAAGKGKAA